jgi:hypoxia up-regulated 1
MLMLVALLGSIWAGKANANVIGFDFGSNFFKIVLVKPANPFQIVENITSKRKTESYLTIGPDDRKFGVDAYNMATKVPKTTFS